ncbi:hypothetical protein C8T65DRAFT_59690 [Cerioporus squamosus]|nr:hypothetical protein C8T65DRAFT_59690 [Cerioporus squamosus]
MHTSSSTDLPCRQYDAEHPPSVVLYGEEVSRMLFIAHGSRLRTQCMPRCGKTTAICIRLSVRLLLCSRGLEVAFPGGWPVAGRSRVRTGLGSLLVLRLASATERDEHMSRAHTYVPTSSPAINGPQAIVGAAQTVIQTYVCHCLLLGHRWLASVSIVAARLHLPECD